MGMFRFSAALRHELYLPMYSFVFNCYLDPQFACLDRHPTGKVSTVLTAVHRYISLDIYDFLYKKFGAAGWSQPGANFGSTKYVGIFCGPHHRSKHLYAILDLTYGRLFSISLHRKNWSFLLGLQRGH